MQHLFKLFFLIIILISCHPQEGETTQPRKINGIPNDAFWIGGKDGGNWYQVVRVHDHNNNAFIKIFDDGTGRLIVSKRFMVICNGIDNPIWIQDLKDQISGFDGEKIYLKQVKGRNHCWLQ